LVNRLPVTFIQSYDRFSLKPDETSINRYVRFLGQSRLSPKFLSTSTIGTFQSNFDAENSQNITSTFRQVLN
jgi:hypothetical protein